MKKGKKRSRDSASTSRPSKPAVEVVVFSETNTAPQRRIRGSKRPTPITSSAKPREGLDFDAAFVEVHTLGTSQLTGWEKREYDSRRITSLGGQAPEKKKMPYNILMGMKRKQHIRRQRQEKLEELAGVVKAKKPKRGPK